MRKLVNVAIGALALACCAVLDAGCGSEAVQQDSGGPVLPEQAAYDVSFYDLRVEVFPERKAIAGRLTARAQLLDSLRWFVLDLDRRLVVDSVRVAGRAAAFERRKEGNQLWIRLERTWQRGERLQARVVYHGRPRVAPNPPWEGGVTWSETAADAPWIATSCQLAGADLWWPVKDHLSDEPDSMAIRVTVPRPLVAASNGRLQQVTPRLDGRRTYRWRVHAPINSYGVALSIAPYDTVRASYRSTAGETVPAVLFVLPRSEETARAALPDYLDQLRFLEKTLGPYPFPDDKYGIAQVPFPGMEHQTLIAHKGPYGQRGGLGYEAPFDALHLHELAHEWMGNSVTAEGFEDLWLHEGFATYVEALYAETVQGDSAYHRLIAHFREQVEGEGPIAQAAPATARQMYGRDLYFRGALVLHALRRRIGDEAFFEVLRRFAGPTRHVSTADFIRLTEAVSGQELRSFFARRLYGEEEPAAEARAASESR